MCKRRRWVSALTVGLLSWVAAGSARAQTQAEYRARVQALVPLRAAELALRAREVSAKHHGLPSDTVRVDSMILLVDRADGELAQAAGVQAAALLRHRFGAGVSGLAGHPFVISATDAMVLGQRAVQIFEVSAEGTVELTSGVGRTERQVGRELAARGARVLTAAAGPQVGAWLRSTIPLDSMDTNAWVGVRVDIVTSSAQVARDCYTGSLIACEYALGVAGGGDPSENWMDAAGRRAMVRTRFRWQTGDRASYGRCVSQGDDRACRALLQLVAASEFQPPLGFEARQSLIGLAFEVGGPGAYNRLLAAPDTIARQLAAAAGIPMDSLVREWRANALGAVAAHTTMTAGMATMSLIWVTVCGALALRSSRWR